MMKLRRLARMVRQRLEGGYVPIASRSALYLRIWEDGARHVGAHFEQVEGDLCRIRRDGAETRVSLDRVPLDNPVVLSTAGNKVRVHRLLAEAGLPVPDWAAFDLDSLDVARRFLADHPGPVVVKPATGTSAGRGVTVWVTTPAGLREAAIEASLFGRELLVETQAAGESYRILCVGGRLLHAVRRRGGRIRGDGAATVGRLVGAGLGDPDVRLHLAAQGLDADTVLPAGVEVVVRRCADASVGRRNVQTRYDEDATALICPGLAREVEAAAAVSGSEYVGVDVITTDPGRPLRESSGVINEVNTTPALHHHFVDGHEAGVARVAAPVLEYLLEKGSTAPARGVSGAVERSAR